MRQRDVPAEVARLAAEVARLAAEVEVLKAAKRPTVRKARES